MIRYLVTRRHAYTMRGYLDTWGRALRERIEVVHYEDVWRRSTLPRGTWVFSDVDRLGPAERALATRAWEALTEAESTLVLNRPGARSRVDLLTELHARRINRFAVHPLPHADSSIRFPVFLRESEEHGGSLTPLLRSPEELRRATLGLLARGRRSSRLLMVEFCDTADESGLYRKYSAFVVGDEVIPRHLVFSREWMLKVPELVRPEHLEEEWHYLESNPHSGFIREVFRTAGLDYGRIDYALLDGAPQVWEINSNPMVMLHPDEYDPAHVPAQEWFAERIVAALGSIDRAADDDAPVPVRFPTGLRTRVRAERLLRRGGVWLGGAMHRAVDARALDWIPAPARRGLRSGLHAASRTCTFLFGSRRRRG